MAVTATDAVMVGAPSHQLDTGAPRRTTISQEDVYPRVNAMWRGQLCRVEMHARRYLASDATRGDVWSSWQVYAERSGIIREDGDPEANYPGVMDPLTPTAHGRLSDACQPLVMAWLDSDEYHPSYVRALGNLIRSTIRESAEHVYLDNPSRDAREMIARYAGGRQGGVLPAERHATLLAACDALDRLGELLEEAAE